MIKLAKLIWFAYRHLKFEMWGVWAPRWCAKFLLPYAPLRCEKHRRCRLHGTFYGDKINLRQWVTDPFNKYCSPIFLFASPQKYINGFDPFSWHDNDKLVLFKANPVRRRPLTIYIFLLPVHSKYPITPLLPYIHLTILGMVGGGTAEIGGRGKSKVQKNFFWWKERRG